MHVILTRRVTTPDVRGNFSIFYTVPVIKTRKSAIFSLFDITLENGASGVVGVVGGQNKSASKRCSRGPEVITGAFSLVRRRPGGERRAAQDGSHLQQMLNHGRRELEETRPPRPGTNYEDLKVPL